MADLRKVRYRGRTYKVKAQRTGKKTVQVKGHCRKRPPTFAERFMKKSDMPF